MSDVLLREHSAGVLALTMNRPEALNALDENLSVALREALDEARRDPRVRCVLLTGAGRGFSSGADLAEAQRRVEQQGSFAPSEILRARYNPIVLSIVEMEKPVVAAVNGIAAGAGASLALACDLRIGSEKTRFLQAFVKIGLIPDAGATYLLPHLVGYARALELALGGDIVEAEEALRLGLLTRVVPAEKLVDEARSLAEQLATGPTLAYALTKKAMRFGATNGLRATLDYEADLQDQASLTHDSSEGVLAFLEKRPARFEGR